VLASDAPRDEGGSDDCAADGIAKIAIEIAVKKKNFTTKSTKHTKKGKKLYYSSSLRVRAFLRGVIFLML
jgi:hypothetical protein